MDNLSRPSVSRAGSDVSSTSTETRARTLLFGEILSAAEGQCKLPIDTSPKPALIQVFTQPIALIVQFAIWFYPLARHF